MMPTVQVFLTDEEAKQFVLFQKRHAFVGLLESMGVFGLRNASVTIHFDHYGQIKTVEKHENYHL